MRGIRVFENIGRDCEGGKIMEGKKIRWGREKYREVWEGGEKREWVSKGFDIWVCG